SVRGSPSWVNSTFAPSGVEHTFTTLSMRTEIRPSPPKQRTWESASCTTTVYRLESLQVTSRGGTGSLVAGGSAVRVVVVVIAGGRVPVAGWPGAPVWGGGEPEAGGGGACPLAVEEGGA